MPAGKKRQFKFAVCPQEYSCIFGKGAEATVLLAAAASQEGAIQGSPCNSVTAKWRLGRSSEISSIRE